MIPLGRSRTKAPYNGELPRSALTSRRNHPSALTNASHNSRRTTFEGEGFPAAVRVHWSRFKRRLGGGSVMSESLAEISESAAGSENASRKYVIGFSGANDADADDDDLVDEIVVDNQMWDGATKSITQASEKGGGNMTPERSGASGTHGTRGDDDSTHDNEGLSRLWGIFVGFYYRFHSAVTRFFFTTFYDGNAEMQYKRETYYQGKALAVVGSIFVIMNWVLLCALAARETMLKPDMMFDWVIGPVLAVPLPVLVIFDFPRKHSVIYQTFMTFSLWSWGAYNLILLNLCGYYNHNDAIISCPGKEFVGIFYYTSAFPVIALFALGQNRLTAAISGVATAVLIGHVAGDKQAWIRNALNFILFMSFIILIHYQREVAERRLFTMRDRLKVQYRATQQAQVRESKASDSKKRFSSYIFHEVRVPLNTALLAVQNMEASGIFQKDDIEFTALEGSLSMMSKVLNDVLDFNRMDSGRFESVLKPYSFHKVVKGMLIPLQMTANARGLQLIIEFDPQIDVVARTAYYLARGDSVESVRQRMAAGRYDDEDDDDESGLVVGDEHRLRQIITNLTSNACKFTPAGGRIWVRTKLLLPGIEEEEGPKDTADVTPGCHTVVHPNGDIEAQHEVDPIGRLSAGQLRLHNAEVGDVAGAPLDKIVIRIEVEDTGVGIRRKDMVDSRLFSPYVQTDIGKFQGGKGTGLGLALSKHIIRLSGGRLGVKSQRNHGSTFWVELGMGIGKKVLEKQVMDGKESAVARTFELSRETTDAFKPAESEGATPSSLPGSSVDASPRNVSFPPPTRPPPSSEAMRQLMEHSGQIELLPRINQFDASTLSLQKSGASSPLSGTSDPFRYTIGPKKDRSSPTDQKKPVSGDTVKPGPMPLPPPRLSYGSSGADGPTPNTPPLDLPPAMKMPHVTSGLASTASSPTGVFDPPLNVLVVDDDGLTRKLMSRMLARIGCNVDTAENGKTALDMTLSAKNPFTFAASSLDDKPRKVRTPYLQAEEPKYDIIFLDNQMPVMSGVEMVRRLRELKGKDFVVGVTGNALLDDQHEYLDAGVDAVLTKPVKEASLRTFLYAADERRIAKLRDESVGNSGTAPSEPP